MSIFDINAGGYASPELTALQNQLRESGIAGQVNKSQTRLLSSLESLDNNQRTEFAVSANNLKATLEAIVPAATDAQLASARNAQIEAATMAAMIGADPAGFMATQLKPSMESTATQRVVSSRVGEFGTWTRPAATMEAYNENNNRDAVLFNVMFNMQASKQDDFAEALFPTIVIPTNQTGVAIDISLPLVFDAVERRLNADVADFKKRNIVRAIVDPTILSRDVNQAIPVYRQNTADKFVASALVAPRDVVVDGKAVKTAPILFNKDLDYIQLSMPDRFLNNQVLNNTDSLESNVQLSNLFVKVGNDVLKFPLIGLPGAEFSWVQNSNYREMAVSFDSTSLVINKETKTASGGALTSLADIVTDDLSVRVRAIVSGKINLETGKLRLAFGGFEMFMVRNSTKEEVPLTSASLAGLVTAFGSAEGLGYELRAYHSNANRRMRGDLIDVTRFSELYNVPLRAPCSAIHPVAQVNPEQTADVENLLALIKTRLHGEAVATLQEAFNTLHSYSDIKDPIGVGPDVLGAGRYWVIPTCFKDTFDANTVQSLNSTDRVTDLMNAMVNLVRDNAYRLHLESEYKPASDLLSGGLAGTPTVIIATDPYIAKYLMINGEMRTLGAELQHKIVTSWNKNMRGKIYLTFGVFDENRNSQINVMNFGNFLFSPEVVTVINQSRGETISNETTVTPRYRYIVNLPVMAEITVKNLPDISKLLPFGIKQL